jgi:hypothetical protein
MLSPRRRYPLSSDVPFYDHPDEENAEDPSFGFEILVKSLVIASFLSAVAISAVIALYPDDSTDDFSLLRR